MAKSIMQDKEDGQCYLCRLLHGDYSIKPVCEEHHVIGGAANRKLSEKYGLKVYLDPEHHRTGREAVHKNAETANLLKEEAQRAFEEAYPALNFREIFGKNYLDQGMPPRQQGTEKPAAAAGQGIREISGVRGMDEGWR